MNNVIIIKYDIKHYSAIKLIESICKKLKIPYSYPDFTSKKEEFTSLSEKEKMILEQLKNN